MIKVTFYESSDKLIKRMSFEGHAGYADSGYDIICSAVSMLFTNTLNSIERFTGYRFKLDEDKRGNRYTVDFTDDYGDDVKILINALRLGLDSVVEQYGNDYLKITLKEV